MTTATVQGSFVTEPQTVPGGAARFDINRYRIVVTNVASGEPIGTPIIVGGNTFGVSELPIEQELRFNVQLIDREGNSFGPVVETSFTIPPEPQPEDFVAQILIEGSLTITVTGYQESTPPPPVTL